MSYQIIFDDGKIGHCRVRHGRKGVFAILRDDNVASPGNNFLEIPSLDLAYAFVDREWHSITRDGWVKYYVRIGKLLVHAVQCFDQL